VGLVLSVAASALSADCPGDQDAAAVLYVTEANMNKIAAYRVCPNGKIKKSPFHRVTVPENPRRLLAACPATGADPCVLYVATRTHIVSFRIEDTGHLSEMEKAQELKLAKFQYLAIHPTGRHLYAAATGLDRIVGYELNDADGSFRRQADGSIDISSCVRGAFSTRYQGLAATETELYASARLPGRLDIFSLADTGAIQAFGQEPGRCRNNKDRSCTEDFDCKKDTEGQRVCVRSYCDGFPDDVDTVTECMTDADCATDDACPPDGECTCVTEQEHVFTDCSRSSLENGRTFATSTSRSFGDPKALLLNGSTLYIVDTFRGRIYSCPIEDLPNCPCKEDDAQSTCNDSRTKQGRAYEQLAVSNTHNVLFASVFTRGTVAAYRLENDRLPRKPSSRSEPNILAAPVGLAACGDALYVAQGDLDKVQAFRIGPKGFKKHRRPFSHTVKIKGSFPNAVAIVPLGPATCDP
jgi:6-phosphogluconolactonase (cycloisomerase 2 family)